MKQGDITAVDTGGVDVRLLRLGAVATIAAALLFPKIEGIRSHGRPLWQLAIFFVPLDLEGLVIIPILVLVTVALFKLVGTWALRDANGRNRPAKVGLVFGVVGLVAIVAFWVSAPIVFGGLAITLGIAGRRAARVKGRGRSAAAAIALGSCAVVAGAAMWSFIT
jgi:hypothetical protein